MWTIIKYKSQELQTAKKNLILKFEDKPIFYLPKIKYQKIVNNCKIIYGKTILENYIICFHPRFSDKQFLKQLNNIRGLLYFLEGHTHNQKDIIKFIKCCESFTNSEGYLTSNFFDNKNFIRGKFISGPFTNMIFDIVSRQKDKIKILIGNTKATLSLNADNLYKLI